MSLGASKEPYYADTVCATCVACNDNKLKYLFKHFSLSYLTGLSFARSLGFGAFSQHALGHLPLHDRDYVLLTFQHNLLMRGSISQTQFRGFVSPLWLLILTGCITKNTQYITNIYKFNPCLLFFFFLIK